MICTLCPRRCGAERRAIGGDGFCGMGTLPVVARAALHRWEEPCISGAGGSGTIFFAGCTLGCAYCQNFALSRGQAGQAISVERLAEIMAELEAQGAENINLVTASHFAPAVVQALALHRPSIPVVWNSGGYESPEILALLDGKIDVYLPDFKVIDPAMGTLLSRSPDYPEVAMAALREMRRQTGPAVYDARGMLRRGTHVRHLVLPGLTADSQRILTWLRDALPDVTVSLMGQYTPCGEAERIPGMNRRITAREYARVLAHMEAIGLEGYRQARASASAAFIPAFDGTGVVTPACEGNSID